MITLENKPELKYRYAVFTWGGFYNKEYQEKHGHVEGQRIFDTLEEREQYITMLRGIELAMQANYLMVVTDEGFAVDVPLVMHRVIKLNGKYYYSEDKVNVWPTTEDSFSTACYHMEWKWYPGFNDEPAGDSDIVDYTGTEIIQEWITGAFKPEYR